MAEATPDWPSPPYRVSTPRCVVRAYGPQDIDLVQSVVHANVDVLRPWMPWAADEPINRAERANQLRRFRGLMDLGTNRIYGVFGHDGAYLGGTGLHENGGHATLEIGYWIDRHRWGEGLATEVAAAMTQVGLRWMGAARIEIRTGVGNTASARVAEKLGYRQEGTLRQIGPPIGEASAMDLMVFGMTADELSGSPADDVQIEERGFGA